MTKIFLRKAEESDCWDILEWRNDPISVKFSPSGKIDEEAHQKWYLSKLSDSNCLFYIITNEEKDKIGMIRLDLKNEEATLSINLNPLFRGRGYGQEGLRKAVKQYFDLFPRGIVNAEIKRDNIASQKIFSKVGFEEVGTIDKMIQVKITNKVKYGLKLWSTNFSWFLEAVKKFEKGEFDFIELYVIPNSFDPNQLKILKNIPVNVHAPNENKLNWCKDWPNNFKIMEEVNKFADFFDSEYIIIHPGTGNDRETLIKNLKELHDPRIIIENVPYEPAFGIEKIYGHTYEMIKELLDLNHSKMCLDFSHAIKSAKSQMIEPIPFLERMLKLNPKVFHVCGVNQNSDIDEHLDLWKGDFDLKWIKEKILSSGSKMIVFEVPKINNNLENDFKNINYFKAL